VQLGQGIRQRRIWTAETDRTSAIAETIAQDKNLTKLLLQAAGVPVPHGRLVSDPADAWRAAEDVGLPVVVKPRDANHGRGVCTNLTTRDAIEAAFPVAAKEGNGVIVEQFARGTEHRLLVIGGRLVAAIRGETAFVVGNGEHNVTQLIQKQLNEDPRRSDDEAVPLSSIELNDVVALTLKNQGYTYESVPTP